MRAFSGECWIGHQEKNHFESTEEALLSRFQSHDLGTLPRSAGIARRLPN